MVKHINENEFKQFVSENSLCVVDFYADWCGPCRMLAQELEEVSSEKGLVIGKVNVDDNENLAMEFNVRNIPFLVVFKDGKMVKSLVGYRSKEQLVSEIYG